MKKGAIFPELREMIIKERQVQHETWILNQTIILMYLYRNGVVSGFFLLVPGMKTAG